MELLEDTAQLDLHCLSNSGIFVKRVDISNLIPCAWEDYAHATRRKIFRQAVFLDSDMVFHNLLLDEYYLFDGDAEWHEDGVNHPVLSIDKNFNEKKWFDSLRIV